MPTGVYKRKKIHRESIGNGIKRAYATGKRKPIIVTYWLGKNRSDDTKQKISHTKMGVSLTMKHRNKISKSLKGRQPKNQVNWSGKNHPCWKGGSVSYRINELKKQVKIPKPEICDICGRKGRICFDHDHKENKFRGWICMKCNVILGMVEDNINTLELIIDYIKKNN